LVWRSSPGCRQRAADVYGKYGGWTEEARRADPIGFIEYAEGKLAEDLEALNQSRRSLADAEQTIELELADTRVLQQAADELAAQCRQAYQEAEASAAYPVEVAGKSYTRADLLEQVELILLQKRNYQQIVEGFEQAAADVAVRQPQLVAQINSIRAALKTLPSKKEIARINQLTGQTEELLGQVNDLIDQNAALLGQSPVRTVEELIQTRDASRQGEAGQVDVRAFLEGAE
jgi:hypothetical protein